MIDIDKLAQEIYPIVIKIVGENGVPDDIEEQIMTGMNNGTLTRQDGVDMVAEYTAEVTYQYANALATQSMKNKE